MDLARSQPWVRSNRNYQNRRRCVWAVNYGGVDYR